MDYSWITIGLERIHLYLLQLVCCFLFLYIYIYIYNKYIYIYTYGPDAGRQWLYRFILGILCVSLPMHANLAFFSSNSKLFQSPTVPMVRPNFKIHLRISTRNARRRTRRRSRTRRWRRNWWHNNSFGKSWWHNNSCGKSWWHNHSFGKPVGGFHFIWNLNDVHCHSFNLDFSFSCLFAGLFPPWFQPFLWIKIFQAIGETQFLVWGFELVPFSYQEFRPAQENL